MSHPIDGAAPQPDQIPIVEFWTPLGRELPGQVFDYRLPPDEITQAVLDLASQDESAPTNPQAS